MTPVLYRAYSITASWITVAGDQSNLPNLRKVASSTLAFHMLLDYYRKIDNCC